MFMKLFTSALLAATTVSMDVNSQDSGATDRIPIAQQPPTGSGGEKVADSPMMFTDPATGAAIAIFESVLNPQRLARGDYAGLRYYVAPLFVLEFPEKPQPVVNSETGDLHYGFNVVCYPDGMMEEALDFLSHTIVDPRNPGTFVELNRTNVLHLSHQMVRFELNVPGAVIAPYGSLDDDVPLAAENRQVVVVPAEQREFFEEMVYSGNLIVQTHMTYNSRDVQRVDAVIKNEEIIEAVNRREAASGGGAFFTAEDTQEILREALRNSSLEVLIDPSVENQLLERALNFVAASADAQQSIAVEDLSQVKLLESQMWEGAGAKPENFQPITLIWDVAITTTEKTDLESINKEIRDSYEEKKDTFEVSFKAGYGPFSATVKKGFERLSQNKEFFENSQHLKDFREEQMTQSGREPRITARGLELVESGRLKSSVKALSFAVFAKPIARVGSRMTPSKIVVSNVVDDPFGVLDLAERVVALEASQPTFRRVASRQNAYNWYIDEGGKYRIKFIDDPADGTRTNRDDDPDSQPHGLPVRIKLERPSMIILSATGWITGPNPDAMHLIFATREFVNGVAGAPKNLGQSYHYLVNQVGRSSDQGQPLTLSGIVELPAGEYEIGPAIVMPSNKKGKWRSHAVKMELLIVDNAVSSEILMTASD